MNNLVKVKQLLNNRIGILNTGSLNFCTHGHSHCLTTKRKTEGMTVRPSGGEKCLRQNGKLKKKRQNNHHEGNRQTVLVHMMGAQATIQQTFIDCLSCARY